MHHKLQGIYTVILSVAVLCIAVGAVLSGCNNRSSDMRGRDLERLGSSPLRIGVVQVVEHPSMNAVRDGFVERMKELGYTDGQEVKYDFENAQGELTTAQSIAQKFASRQMDLILTIGTSVSQAVVKTVQDTPVIFGAVTDPMSAGLLGPHARSGRNVTGVSDRCPVEAQLTILKRLAPTVRTLGIVYNPGETNSVFGVEQTRLHAQRLGIEVKTSTITASSEVHASGIALVSKVDALYTGTDNTVLSSLESLIKVCDESRKPLLAADTESVERGALVTVGLDYLQIGRDCAELALKILKEGVKPADLPVQYASGKQVAVNIGTANKLAIKVPKEVLQNSAIYSPRDTQ